MHYKPTNTPPLCDQPSVGLAHPPVPPARPGPIIQVASILRWPICMNEAAGLHMDKTKPKTKTN